MARQKQRGVVIFVSRKGNFVFIQPEDSEERLFCHRSEFKNDKDIKMGTIVRFRVRKDDCQQVKNVTREKTLKIVA